MNKEIIIKYLDEAYKISKTEKKDILKYDAEKFKEEIFGEGKSENNFEDKKNLEPELLKSFDNCKLDDKIKFNKMKKKQKLVSIIKNYDNQSYTVHSETNKEKMNQTLNNFNQNLDKIKDNIDCDVQTQLRRFEEIKRKKKEIAQDKNNKSKIFEIKFRER